MQWRDQVKTLIPAVKAPTAMLCRPVTRPPKAEHTSEMRCPRAIRDRNSRGVLPSAKTQRTRDSLRSNTSSKLRAQPHRVPSGHRNQLHLVSACPPCDHSLPPLESLQCNHWHRHRGFKWVASSGRPLQGAALRTADAGQFDRCEPWRFSPRSSPIVHQPLAQSHMPPSAQWARKFDHQGHDPGSVRRRVAGRRTRSLAPPLDRGTVQIAAGTSWLSRLRLMRTRASQVALCNAQGAAPHCGQPCLGTWTATTSR